MRLPRINVKPLDVLKALALVVALAAPALAAEINDLAQQSAAPRLPSPPLGLPEIVWWLFAIVLLCAAVIGLARINRWVADRLYEPSTHACAACFFGFGGLFISSLSFEPVPLGQAMLLAGFVLAFIGLITREGGRS